MKLSDYIVSMLIEKGITDVFGYPGGMVTHLMDSFDKYKSQISAHVNYHEQASSFAACGYAQVSHKPGIAYATSGPGATNLITGIANAYFDSIPCIFITGQVNTYESKGNLLVRQKGFQETDIVSIVESITKYAVQVNDAADIKYEIEKAWKLSMDERPGPVLIDIPMNIQHAEIMPEELKGYEEESNITSDIEEGSKILLKALEESKKPVILAGHGIACANVVAEFRKFAKQSGIPIVTSMTGKDVIEEQAELNFGFVGAYGNRCANFIISNSDLIISMGSRIDCRQTGSNIKVFAEQAKVVRIDVDLGEVTNKIKDEEISIIASLQKFLSRLNSQEFNLKNKYVGWLDACHTIKKELEHIDEQYENDVIRAFSHIVPDNATITTDVGQNQVWVAQSFVMKDSQRMLFSGGHGAMGYSLPAAIGAYYGNKQNVVCFNGDGGLQMNIQELQFIIRENIPIKIVVLNNKSLGMIRHFQEMYFESNFVQTKASNGYTVPDFDRIADAYDLRYVKIENIEDITVCKDMLEDNKPCFIEIGLCDTTYVSPKLAMGRPIHDQYPLLERNLFERLMGICNV